MDFRFVNRKRKFDNPIFSLRNYTMVKELCGTCVPAEFPLHWFASLGWGFSGMSLALLSKTFWECGE